MNDVADFKPTGIISPAEQLFKCSLVYGIIRIYTLAFENQFFRPCAILKYFTLFDVVDIFLTVTASYLKN